MSLRWKAFAWRNNSPVSFELKLGPDLRIVVVRNHIYCPDDWVMHCPPWFDTYPVGPLTLPAEEAQSQALALVREKLDLIQAQLRGIN